MLRILGAGLILCGGLLARQTLVGSARCAQRTRRALAAELETMESEIRLLLTPLPELLRRGAARSAFSASVTALLAGGGTLTEAWRAAAETLPLPPEEREQLAALGDRLDGDETGVCAALALAAARLRGRYDEVERSRAQTERLTTSLCLSAGLLLVILLL